MWGLLALVLAIGIMGSALASGSALAAKGSNINRGGGKGHGGTPTASTVTMAVSPNPPTGGQTFIVSGTGFAPGAAVNFFLGSGATYAMADQSGYAWTPWTIALPGTYTIGACQFTSKGCQQVGTITFNVVQ
ncbi:MAG TPA: hypothetical protein VFT91_02280 [Dehalococcoidia bacterium]|nr:hypothetical protein [Dehalococcoidia bacterium]